MMRNPLMLWEIYTLTARDGKLDYVALRPLRQYSPLQVGGPETCLGVSA
jgi:hypothetical protein